MVTRSELFKEMEHELSNCSPGTRNQYMAKVSDYLDFVQQKKGSLQFWSDRDTLYQYMDFLKKRRHLSQSTINFYFNGAIGTLFRMQQPSLRLPVKLPKTTRANVLNIEERVQFTEEEIVSLILAARASENPQWQNLMALASIYMIRAGEIQKMTQEDVHPLKRTIMVHTEKGGMLREHLVPQVMAPYILKYDYPPLPGKKVHVIFNEIAEASGVNHDGRKNIHAVRHGVFTTLANLRGPDDKLVYEQIDVFRFGRWAGSGITEIYNHPKMLENDERIFKNHSFLKYWK